MAVTAFTLHRGIGEGKAPCPAKNKGKPVLPLTGVAGKFVKTVNPLNCNRFVNSVKGGAWPS
jgi:hypothetical protein